MMNDRSDLLPISSQNFLAEAEEITDKLAMDLADLSDLVGSGGDNPDLLNAIFRGAHSLKGLAGLFGFSAISELSHRMESLLDRLRLGKLDLEKPVMWLLFESQALLKALLRDVAATGQPGHGDEIAACGARIDAALSSSGGDDNPPSLKQIGLPDELLSSLTEYEQHRLRENLEKGKKLYSVHASYDLASFDGALTRLTQALKGHGEIICTLPGAGDDPDSQISFDILYGTSEDGEKLLEPLGDAGGTVARLSPPASPRPGVESEAPPAVPAAESAAVPDRVGEPPLPSVRDEALSVKSMSRTVRVDIAKLDELMNIVGELALAHASINDIALAMGHGEFSPLAVDLARASRLLERRLSALRKGVAEIRMIPVGQLYERISLIVRTISRELGKKVEPRFLGADTELDKLIIEEISDPLMHIVRNAVDHGIEHPEQRVALGKNETGVISVSARQKGSHVVIEVRDDGGGIDLEKVRDSAVRKRLVPDAARLSDDEVLEFIFLPGFSTSDQVSDVSGRGVGMDVVRNNIAAISGMVDVETARGRGTRFRITLPITLAMIKALIVSCAGRTYALPVAALHESLLVTDGDIRVTERGELFQLRGTAVPLLRLERFFGLDRPERRPDEYYVVVAGIADTRMGLVVDDLLGQQEIVIKSLGEAFRGLKGISGATDLGELGTILVLDPAAMISAAGKSGI
jgi:two-component system chemotaxis sensor kinase CheA